MIIPFNKPYMTGNELKYISEAHSQNILAGDGPFTKKCHKWLEQALGTKKALLTHSCTAALEIAAILINVKPGDEIILPSYTFVSTANAFVLRGGVPIFVDVRKDTLNIDENKIEAAITSKTKAIVPVHYAGIGCEMDTIMNIAKQYGLYVIEDAAQGIYSKYKDKKLGTIGDIGCYSFHETKNIIAGEGGAILINNEIFYERAEIIREKGTNRTQFFKGKVDKYSWQDIGSSYLPGEVIAAFLWAQLEEAFDITNKRLQLWEKYHSELKHLENENTFQCPTIPDVCIHNAHMYYILLNSNLARSKLIDKMNSENIYPVSHYIPLHSSKAGKKFGRVFGSMINTDYVSSCILRLPLWIGMEENDQGRIINIIRNFYNV